MEMFFKNKSSLFMLEKNANKHHFNLHFFGCRCIFLCNISLTLDFSWWLSLSTVSWSGTMAQMLITKGNTFLRLVYLCFFFFLNVVSVFTVIIVVCFPDSRLLLSNIVPTFYSYIFYALPQNSFLQCNAQYIIIMSNKSICTCIFL